jgi:hypothetical protein
MILFTTSENILLLVNVNTSATEYPFVSHLLEITKKSSVIGIIFLSYHFCLAQNNHIM